MGYRFRTLAVVLLAATVSVPLRGGQTPPALATQQLPPISYVCTMPGDEAVRRRQAGHLSESQVRHETGAGQARLEVLVSDASDQCREGRTRKVPAGSKRSRAGDRLGILDLRGQPDRSMLEPGNCANGQPRKIGYELRAHGDHNPRHGGQFFMAEDLWHHIEGALPGPGALRAVYFYDNFTKPIPPNDFTARVVRETNSNAETVTLTPSADGKILQARLTPSPMPVKLKAWVKFSKDTREQPFDFVFDKLSVEPVVAPVATTTSRTPAPSGTTASPAPATPAPSTAAAATPQTPAPAAAPPPRRRSLPLKMRHPTPPTSMLSGSSGIPPALAEAWDESKLPSAIPDF